MRELWIFCLLLAIATAAGQEPAGSGFKWAWDMPDTVSEKYPTTEYSYWLPPSVPVGGGLRFLHLRDREENEDFVLSGYMFFRPVVLDFSENYLAMGAYLGFDNSWGEGTDFYDLMNPDARYKTESGNLAAGFSLLLSLPESRIEMTLELGHFWSRGKLKISDLTLLTALATTDGEFRAIQKETGLDMFYNFTVLAGWAKPDEWSYLTALSVNFVSSYRTGPVEMSAKEIHPPSIEVEIEPARSDFALGLVYVKALAIPIRELVDSTIVSRYEFITLEAAGGAGHFAVDHGHVWTAGCRVSLADIVAFSYFHSWEQRNNVADSDIFFLEVGFQLGTRLSGGR